MAELKRIDEAENENKKSRDVHFGDFPLEQFSDAGKVANEGDPQLKAAADTELYEIEKRAIQKNMTMTIPVDALMILITAKELKTIIQAKELKTIIPAKELMTITAKELMMMMKMIYYKLKLVTCNYLKMEKNIMLIMMKIHCVKWFTDQRMCHTMQTARNYCCRKQQICHEKTI